MNPPYADPPVTIERLWQKHQTLMPLPQPFKLRSK